MKVPFFKQLFYALDNHAQSVADRLNNHFNRMSTGAKKGCVIAFGTLCAFLCVCTSTGLLKLSSTSITNDNITMPKSIQEEMKDGNSEKLIPLGKMKGEHKGEFESFYVAIDKDARVFINRDIRYDSTAYSKSRDWKEITMAELKDYNKSLHFKTFSTKGKNISP
jgi:hypothetical protein